MIQARCNPRLGQIHLGIRFVGDQIRMRNLDRNRSIELFIVGEINHSKTASPQLPLDPIASDSRRHHRHGGASADVLPTSDRARFGVVGITRLRS